MDLKIHQQKHYLSRSFNQVIKILLVETIAKQFSGNLFFTALKFSASKNLGVGNSQKSIRLFVSTIILNSFT